MKSEKRHRMVLCILAYTASIIFQGSNASPASVVCEEEGIFPVLEYCDMYYKCVLHKRNLFFPVMQICPNGTVFDMKNNTCLEPYLVTGRPKCTSVLATTPEPTTTALPPEPIRCEEEGMFPMHGQCDAYYKCYYIRGGRILAFDIKLCPSGTVFDDEKDSCLHPNQVTSRPECMTEDKILTTDTGFQDEITEVHTPNITRINTGETTTSNYLSSPEELIPDLNNVTPTMPVPTDTDDINRILSTVPSKTYIAQGINETTNETYITEGMHDNEEGESVKDIHKMIQEVAKISRYTCQNVCVIGRYVNRLTSSVPLQVAQYRHPTLKRYIVSYNAALEKSQSTLNAWRHDTNILSDIRQIFNLAKQYELEFDHKYKIYKEREMSSSSSTSDRATELGKDIEILKRDIKNIEEIMEISSEAIKPILLNQLNRYQTDLERKNQTLQQTLSANRFTSPVTFLGMVSNEAGHIENITKDLKIRIAAWYSELHDNVADLDEKSVNLNRTIESIKTLILNKRNVINKKKNDLTVLQSNKKILESSISTSEDEVDTNFDEIRNLLATIKKKEDEREKLVYETCKWVTDDLLETCKAVRRSTLPDLDLTAYYENLRQLQDINNRKTDGNMATINRDSTEINTIEDQIREKQNEVQKLRLEIRYLEATMSRLQAFISQQTYVKQAWTSTTNAIKLLIRDLGKLKTTFQSIYANLEELMSEVRDTLNETGENKSNLQEIRNVIEQDLNLFQHQIDHSSVTIQEIIDCP